MYQIKRVFIGKSPQLDALAHACGEVYSQTLVSFWRVVRKKGIWLKAKHLMRMHTSSPTCMLIRQMPVCKRSSPV